MAAAMVGCSFAATYCDHDLISMAFGAGAAEVLCTDLQPTVQI
jgi:hypothetical protein